MNSDFYPKSMIPHESLNEDSAYEQSCYIYQYIQEN